MSSSLSILQHFLHLCHSLLISCVVAVCITNGTAFADSKDYNERHIERRDSQPAAGKRESGKDRKEEEQHRWNDPSKFTGPLIGEPPDDLPGANLGAFEGGDTGTSSDAGANNSLSEDFQRDDAHFNIPSNGAPSPLYGAIPLR